jgi:hypothetical protein
MGLHSVRGEGMLAASAYNSRFLAAIASGRASSLIAFNIPSMCSWCLGRRYSSA